MSNQGQDKIMLPTLSTPSSYEDSSNSFSSDNFTCPICYDSILYFGFLINCCHYFCLSCIRQWRNDANKLDILSPHTRCPTCREYSPFILPSKDSSLCYIRSNPDAKARKQSEIQSYFQELKLTSFSRRKELQSYVCGDKTFCLESFSNTWPSDNNGISNSLTTNSTVTIHDLAVHLPYDSELEHFFFSDSEDTSQSSHPQSLTHHSRFYSTDPNELSSFSGLFSDLSDDVENLNPQSPSFFSEIPPDESTDLYDIWQHTVDNPSSFDSTENSVSEDEFQRSFSGTSLSESINFFSDVIQPVWDYNYSTSYPSEILFSGRMNEYYQDYYSDSEQSRWDEEFTPSSFSDTLDPIGFDDYYEYHTGTISPDDFDPNFQDDHDTTFQDDFSDNFL